VLLTRSPLSPGPKAWFSLDLHVLSAPPAFVLSQDQTLREEWLSRRPASEPARQLVHIELELKGHASQARPNQDESCSGVPKSMTGFKDLTPEGERFSTFTRC
jgi:hypothetical protein